ncbi:AAA family ATPase [Halogeometricum borinquense]|uniref:AAA family ATPase n=1 Tax=Halogeometricum borinquense TaxID=60847 RepID=A0A482TM65_9EURY|nr:MoxR family ATPase [Halogeometricum borinquense]RYJ15013.1 AAA family ATPase [Halogeometricum borinquense]
MSSHLKIEDVHDAIENGARTKNEIAEVVGKSPSNTNRKLKAWVENEDVRLDRHWNHGDGGGYVYTIPAKDEIDDAEDLPILGSRNYDWGRFVPDTEDVPVYRQAERELDEIEAVLKARDATGQLPRFQISGPTGCGKTTLAEYLAADRGAPMITIQCNYALRGAELLGTPQIVGGDVMWVDGPLTRALLASREREALVLIDEVTRATARSKGTLFPALDHRAEVKIKPRGNELISGVAEDMITVATMNEGQDYETEALDAAEERRLGLKWELPYLGQHSPDLEAELVATKTPMPSTDARVLVDAANVVRDAAEDESEPAITRGVPTPAVISWAQTAYAFAERGLNDPVGRAMQSAVVKPVYDEVAGDVAGKIHSALKRADHEPDLGPEEVTA